MTAPVTYTREQMEAQAELIEHGGWTLPAQDRTAAMLRQAAAGPIRTPCDEAAETVAQERERLRSALQELYATVLGECPNLLDEDSGGDARLALEIGRLLSTPIGLKVPR